MSGKSITLTDWHEGWKRTRLKMLKEKRERLKNINISLVIEQLDDAFLWALSNSKPKKTSGLVELQRLLKRIHP